MQGADVMDLASDVEREFAGRGWAVFTRGDLNLNLAFLRGPNRRADRFDDAVLAWFNEEGRRTAVAFRATVDPGGAALAHPRHPRGVARLVEGQYRGGWRIGVHGRGRSSYAPDRWPYPCLVQARTLNVIRDANRDDVLDPGAVVSDAQGINVHAADLNPFLKATRRGPDASVGRWSEGCVVLADGVAYVAEWFPLLARAAHVWGPTFTGSVLEVPAIPPLDEVLAAA